MMKGWKEWMGGCCYALNGLLPQDGATCISSYPQTRWNVAVADGLCSRSNVNTWDHIWSTYSECFTTLKRLTHIAQFGVMGH